MNSTNANNTFFLSLNSINANPTAEKWGNSFFNLYRSMRLQGDPHLLVFKFSMQLKWFQLNWYFQSKFTRINGPIFTNI